MNTEHPSASLFFVFAHTFCRLRVYDTEVKLARELLECAGVELLVEEPESAHEVDTRLLIHLASRAMPAAIEKLITKTKKGIGESLTYLGVEPC